MATIGLGQDDVEPLVKIAASLDRPEEKAERNEFLERAADSVFGEKSADGFKKVGDLLYASQQYQSALEYLQKAERGYGAQDSNLPPTLRSIAMTYERLGNNEDALKYYRLALERYETSTKSPGTVVTSLKSKIQQLSGSN
jgi:tetratricopeptide (TPR) repeat protein